VELGLELRETGAGDYWDDFGDLGWWRVKRASMQVGDQLANCSNS
jgi:hypothetical protein